MKLHWTDFAIEMLLEIHEYYKEKASPSIARKTSGQIELNLEKLNEGHRYLVKGNYKIIYKEIADGLLITDVFDTRQDPIKLNDEERKPVS